MRRTLLSLLLFCPILVAAQTTSKPEYTPEQKAEARKLAQKNMSAMSAEQKKQWNVTHRSRVPSKKNFSNVEEQSTQVQQNQSNQSNQRVKLAASPRDQVGARFTVPGEFEESQGAFLSWPYYAFDIKGNQLDPFTKDFGYHYLDNKGNYEVVPIAGYEIDTSTTGDYPLAKTWAELADAIQKELPVWVLVYNDEDTTVLKTFMSNNGRPLTNYRFFNVGGGNAFWTRDFGPVGFYYGDQDSVGFIDLMYYAGRAADDSIPNILAQQLGYKHFGTQLKFEGGNFMCDGRGMGFTSSMVDTINLESYGQGYVKYDSAKKAYTDVYANRGGWTAKKTLDTLKGVLGCTTMTVMPTLVCDGGTGHIDMYTKLFDEETIISSVYPQEFNNKDFPDYAIALKNVNNQKKMNSTFARPYRVFTMPIPTSDDGQYDSTTYDTFNADPRGFLNGLTINKTFIFPSFSSDGSGNETLLQEVVKLYKEYLPGYKLVPIDSRILTPMAGAIHCITMQVPAENPIRFHHAAWRGNVDTKASYPLLAEITNRSGIAKATAKWRKKGESAWRSIDLTAGSANTFTESLPGSTAATLETIEYYVEATSNNGKTGVLPITAPEGFYSFSYGSTVNVHEEDPGTVSEMYPNPVTEECVLPLSLRSGGTIRVIVSDVHGTTVDTQSLGYISPGPNLLQLHTSSLDAGMYIVHIERNGTIIAVRKFIRV